LREKINKNPILFLSKTQIASRSSIMFFYVEPSLKLNHGHRNRGCISWDLFFFVEREKGANDST